MSSRTVKHDAQPKRLAISAAVAVALLSAYGSRRTYAGTCTGAAGTYSCSGAADSGTDFTQTLNSGASALTVTTTPGFGIDTSVTGGDALNLNSKGSSLSFTDPNTSFITGALSGIRASNYGIGATSITSTGIVTGTNYGVFAYNTASTTDLTISTAAVTGGVYGILAGQNFGTGATSITSTGTVTGTSSSGIFVRNSGTDLTINTVAVSGGTRGIRALNFGNGATSITTTGLVTGKGANGIEARNYTSATSLSINSIAVTGGDNGIFALNNGKGATSITSTGLVTGTGTNGIYALNGKGATSITINTAAVTGGINGINARNSGTGTGDTSITSTGTITGTANRGIYAYNGTSATNLNINTAAVTGGTDGIYARNFGTGATSITSTGTITGTTRNGINADNNTNATNLTINTAAVTGGTDGIYARNFGTGDTSITSTGTITGTTRNGIYAYNDSSANNLTISTAAVTGGTKGIFAQNNGTGATSITSTGTVTGGAKGEGVYASNSSIGTDLTISTADVSGGFAGIFAYGKGTGATSITSTGSVTGTNYGIFAVNYGKGATSITSTGSVTGVYTAGISIFSQTASNNTITLNSGATVSASSGLAIADTAGDTTVTVNTGASVTGSVNLGTGNDQLILNGGTLNVQNGFALAVTGNVINSTGTINLRNNTIDAPATINGNFTGGGLLRLDANFATDTADRLNITGNVLAGGTQVSVNDISTGPATGNPITLVSVGGATAAGDFALAAPVVNGAFNYNTLALVGQDWVLQSVAAVTGPGAGAPVYTPFAASFEALGQSLITLAALPTLAARTQQSLVSNTTGGNSGDETGIDSPVWLRINGGYRDIDSHRSTTGANFDTGYWNALLGVDFTVADTSKGRFVTGVYAGYGQADTDVQSTAGKSKIDTTAYSLGLTGTWYGANEIYVDTQLQRSWYNTDLSASGVGAGKVDDIGGDGYSVSVEVGKEIALSDRLRITPQAQLMYAKVDADRFTGANAEVVDIANSKSLRARLGTLLTKRFTEDGATTGFVIASVIREFEDETQVNVSGALLSNSVDPWNGELGLGMAHSWNKGATHYALSARVTGTTSLNNVGDNKAAQGEVGFKVNF